MKKILGYIIIVIVAFVLLTAAIETERNNKTYWNNVGSQLNVATTFIVIEVKIIYTKIRNGYNE